jgi:DNA-binding MarR family transcriptional regulator
MIVNMIDDRVPTKTSDRSAGMADVVHLLASIEGLQRRIGQGLQERSRAHGLVLRGSEGRILHLIAPEGTRPSVLAEGWVSKQAIGRRIDEMAKRGLVTVGPDPQDGRAVIVRRTAEGDRIRQFTLDQIADLEAELAAAVGPQRYRVFREVIDDLARDHLPTALRSAAEEDERPINPVRPRGRRR